MIAIRTASSIVVWCHVPKLLRVIIADMFKAAPPKIIPDKLLDKDEMQEFVEFEKQTAHIHGRYLEKVKDEQ